jgi:hypothetical protein
MGGFARPSSFLVKKQAQETGIGMKVTQADATSVAGQYKRRHDHVQFQDDDKDGAGYRPGAHRWVRGFSCIPDADCGNSAVFTVFSMPARDGFDDEGNE